ncbi:MAG: NMCC_0638 family (lipo)protein [Shewanella sp.]
MVTGINKNILGLLCIGALVSCGEGNSQPIAKLPQEKTVSSVSTASVPTGVSTEKEKNLPQIFAQQAANLFFNVCIKTLANEEKVIKVAEENKMLELNSEQKQEFNFETMAKRVWGAHSKDGGRFFIAAGKNYCSLKVKKVDTQLMQQQVEKIMTHIARESGSRYQKIKEGAIDGSATAKQIAYSLDKEGGASILLVALVDSSDQAGAQGALNLHVLNSQ